MTCENCIHLPVCILRLHWGVGSDWNNRYTPDVEKRCKSFKNEADVVKVRCKDCEYYQAYFDSLEGFYGQCLVRERNIGENDFCSYGKRKEGAN